MPATVPMTPPPAPAAAMPPPPAARPSSSRGLWLALGVVLGLAVLVSAATYIPRHIGTHADPKNAPPTTPAAPDSSASSTDNSSAPGTPNKPLVSLKSDQGSLQVDANGNVSLDSPKGSLHVDADSGAVTMSDKSGATVAAKSNRNPANGKQIPAPPVASAPPTPAPPPGPSPEDIAKMEDTADKLNVRASTATQSVETLRKQQMASGFNLRADIASSEERMQIYMSKGNDALKGQDLANAQKYFDLADKELIKIEKFLGH
jgi:hypothetical protein